MTDSPNSIQEMADFIRTTMSGLSQQEFDDATAAVAVIANDVLSESGMVRWVNLYARDLNTTPTAILDDVRKFVMLNAMYLVAQCTVATLDIPIELDCPLPVLSGQTEPEHIVLRMTPLTKQTKQYDA